MQNRRKQKIAAVTAAVTLLSAMVLPGGMTALAAENALPPSACGQQAAAAPLANTTSANTLSANTPSADILSANTPSADVPAAAEMVNTSFLSADTISRGQSVKVWLFSEKGTGTVRYSVYYKKAASAKWSKMAENTSAAFVKLKPSVATDYVVKVEAKDSSGNTAAAELPLKVTEPLSNTSFLSSESISYGGSLKAYCRSEGGVGETNYAVYYKRSAQTKWIRSKDYSTSCVAQLRPKAAASYDVRIKARDESGVISVKTMTVWVKSASDLQNCTELSAGEVAAGKTVRIGNMASGGKGEVQFAAYYRAENEEKWSKISAYTTAEYLNFTPQKKGAYLIRTKVKDGSGRIINKDMPLTVTEKEPEPVFAPGEIDDTIDSRMIKTAEEYAAMQQEADPSYTLPAELPDRVDNSTNEYFPAIVHQVGSSCASYSTTYNQYTYEYNRLHQIPTDENHTFSPAYAYNMANDKKSWGMELDHAYHYLKQGGAVTPAMMPFGSDVSDSYQTGPFPGAGNNTSYYTYDLPLDEETYRYASDHRIRYSYELPQLGHYDDKKKIDTIISSPDDEDLIPMKTALADGHVLTIYCYDTWRMKQLKAAPDPAVNKGVFGQNSIYYSFSQNGAHFVTVVGYDDHIWTDINENGEIDDGEMGALKIANTWGENWKNSGFIWMAYDALNHRSCVEGFAYEPADQKALDENDKLEKPNNGIQRWHGAFYMSGIQLMPENYHASVFMHYIANTNDRANSFAWLTGEYNGKTLTECMDPFHHPFETKDQTEFVPIAYNLSYPDEYAHFVYDISTMVRKLGAADYTDVRWTVKLECKGSSSAFMKVSDLYLCDEKNYRLYRTEGSFPTVISGSSSVSLPLSERYSQYAKINYRGFSDRVDMYYYNDDTFNTSDFVTMSRESCKEGYTHYALLDLGQHDYNRVSFYSESGRIDDNEMQDYMVFPGENDFETLESVKPLKINLINESGTQCAKDSQLMLLASTEGGVGSYRYRYTVRDLSTGKTVVDSDYHEESEYDGYADNEPVFVTSFIDAEHKNSFFFSKTGKYQVTVYVSDATGNTVHTGYVATVKDFAFSRFETAEGRTLFDAGEEFTLCFDTENDDFGMNYTIAVYRDNTQQLFREIWPFEDELSEDIVETDEENHSASVKTKLTLTECGEYRIVVRRGYWENSVTAEMIVNIV